MFLRSSVVVALLMMVSVTEAVGQSNWPYTPRAESVATPPNVKGEFAATVIGLPSLTEQTLPARYREYRFEVECGLCLPTYLIQLKVHPSGRVSGAAYLLWFPFDSAAATDTSERIRRMNEPPNNCASSLKKSRGGPQYGYRWCEARLSKGFSWDRLLRQLDSLQVFGLPTAAGYSPDPPTIQVDTIKGLNQKFLMPRRDCGDMVSKSLAISAVVGSEYRAAFFWCLESKIPGYPEHARVSRAYDLLHDVVLAYHF